MPTIYHRSRFLMVGTLSLCPPYGLEGAVREAGPIAARSGPFAEAQYAPFIGVQLNCGCGGAPCMVSAGACAAVLANGAGAIVSG